MSYKSRIVCDSPACQESRDVDNGTELPSGWWHAAGPPFPPGSIAAMHGSTVCAVDFCSLGCLAYWATKR